MDMMGMLETKQGVCQASFDLYVVVVFFFWNEKTINDGLNMGTNFGFPSQGGPRRPLPRFFFLRNVALFFNIVYLADTSTPAPLSEVCVCPCNTL